MNGQLAALLLFLITVATAVPTYFGHLLPASVIAVIVFVAQAVTLFLPKLQGEGVGPALLSQKGVSIVIFIAGILNVALAQGLGFLPAEAQAIAGPVLGFVIYVLQKLSAGLTEEVADA